MKALINTMINMIFGKYCRYCRIFTVAGFEGPCWIGRGVKGSARLVDQMMSFSLLSLSGQVTRFALRWNLLCMKLKIPHTYFYGRSRRYHTNGY